MRWTVCLYCSLMLWLGACRTGWEGPTAPRKAQQVLMGRNDAFMQGWTLYRIVDPYNSGTVTTPDAPPERLVFFRDGTFLQYDRWNHSEGRWYLQPADSRMALIYSLQNGQPVPTARRDSLFRYVVRCPAPDTLVLSIQGRHGMVEYFYQP